MSADDATLAAITAVGVDSCAMVDMESSDFGFGGFPAGDREAGKA